MTRASTTRRDHPASVQYRGCGLTVEKEAKKVDRSACRFIPEPGKFASPPGRLGYAAVVLHGLGEARRSRTAVGGGRSGRAINRDGALLFVVAGGVQGGIDTLCEHCAGADTIVIGVRGHSGPPVGGMRKEAENVIFGGIQFLYINFGFEPSRNRVVGSKVAGSVAGDGCTTLTAFYGCMRS